MGHKGTIRAFVLIYETDLALYGSAKGSTVRTSEVEDWLNTINLAVSQEPGEEIQATGV